MRTIFLVSILLIAAQARCQTISYISPDAAAPGMSVAIEFVGPNTELNFGNDGLNQASVRFVNASDSSRIVLGPTITSWNGRIVSAMVFVKDSIQSGSIPLMLSAQGGYSNVDTFHIVEPQHLGALSNGGALGSGGALGTPSRRNVLVVDSLILSSGAFTISSSDPDPATAGNQAYLPCSILSKGPVRISGRLSVSATGLQAIAGGGGGGGARRFVPGGDGFTAGGGTEEPGGNGSGSGPAQSNQGGGSLNGITGGIGCVPDDQGGGGGTGFPFGSSGQNGTWYANGGVSKSGGYGGASAGGEHSDLDSSYGGGGGGFGSDGGTGSFNGDNRGKGYGNPMIVPFCGGSGGGAANTYGQGSPGSGGGGGGAISIVSYDEMTIDQTTSADGADGESSTTGYAGGGGGGSGGSIQLSSQDLVILNNSLSAIGGDGGSALHALNGGGLSGGNGGGGRIRINGQLLNANRTIAASTSYVGPTVKKCLNASFESSALEGTGNPGDSIYIFLRTDSSGWNYARPYRTKVQMDSTWYYPLIQPRDGRAYVAVLQQNQSVSDLMLYQPDWVMSHTSGAILCLQQTTRGVKSEIPSLNALRVTLKNNADEGHIVLSITGAIGTLKLQLFDLLGREVYSQNLPPQNPSNIYLSKASLRSGTYVYRVESDGQVVSGKLEIVE
jgi:hypothetical protein